MSFDKLSSTNVNGMIELVEGKKYLTWSKAWKEFCKVYPDATYEIVKAPNGMPYFYDHSGAVVYTRVTADSITREMLLPVMDSKHKPMKTESYEYTTKYGTKSVEAFSMFDINKTVMRCLTKNLAMFGLGLYIYEGEDFPEPSQEQVQEKKDVMKLSNRVVSILDSMEQEQSAPYRNELSRMKQQGLLTVEYLEEVIERLEK